MISFEKFYNIEEAISLKNVRKTNLRRSSGGAYRIDIINQVFGNKDRLVYDLDLSSDELINVNNPIIKKILEFLEKNYPDYELKNKKDYVDGICFKKRDTERKQPTKIGKLLQKHINEEGVSDLLDSFKKDPIRSTKLKTSKVVISRHPYDIAGMSTDRSWRSCMTYGFKGINYPEGESGSGINVRYVQNDISYGSIVAYLVSPEDVLPNGKIALKRPLSRILMKPHVNSENNKDYAYSLGRTYGASNQKFSEFVENWLKENINKNTKGKTYLIYSELYDDGDKTVNFTAIKQGSKIANDVFFNLLSDSTDRKYFDNFTVNSGNNYYGGVFLEFGINFKVPDNIKLTQFRYQRDDTLPKYLEEILNKINLKEIRRNQYFDFSLIQSFEDTNTLLVEYRYSDQYLEQDLDEKGNPINDDEYMRDYWNHVLGYLIGIDKINYQKIYKNVVDILSKADPEKEKNDELISIKNDFKKFIEESQKSPTLTGNLSSYKNKRKNFERAKKYINSLGKLSIEQFANIYKNKEFSDNIEVIYYYKGLYNKIREAIMRYVPSNYSLISPYTEWKTMTDNYLDSKNLLLNVPILSISEFITQLHQLADNKKLTPEERNEIRYQYDDYRDLSKNS